MSTAAVDVALAGRWSRALGDAIEREVRGKRPQIDLLLCAVAAGGHVLLEDVPGTGKTTLAKTLAAVLGLGFKRVQFTPDLLPTDLLGTTVYEPQAGRFSFRPGPVFTSVLLADEINRASPRTQSALLEAMSEGQVSLDGETRPLPKPFLCIATQNPVEFHGTYPLPEAQLDRFALQFALGYPAESEERALIEGAASRTPPAPPVPIELAAQVQAMVEAVRMESSVAGYLHGLVKASRSLAGVRLGVSVRGALTFARMVRAKALLAGRDHVLPEDVKALALPCLSHRLVLDARAQYAGQTRPQLVETLLGQVAVPR